MEKLKLLFYCPKSKPYMTIADVMHNDQNFHTEYATLFNYSKEDAVECFGELYNGKVVAECDFEAEKITYRETDKNNYSFGTKTLTPDELLYKSCLTILELCKYIGSNKNWAKGDYGKAIHIKNLNIYDEPKELSDYYKKYGNIYTVYYMPLVNAPQNIMYVYDSSGNKYILISIHPKQLCNILNEKQTIIIRKKVLKEMIKWQ